MEDTKTKDINNKNIFVGDKVKFFAGDNERDPFGFWVEGFVTIEDNEVFGIREENSKGNNGLWDFHGKELELLNK